MTKGSEATDLTEDEIMERLETADREEAAGSLQRFETKQALLDALAQARAKSG